ncbi:hypothetical protein CK222_25760 [Mesorhizobium sp. WSM3866]|nr:hypothetical protein CK222_25760 [Mesorhizobium sp. WSM3866]
MVSDCPARPRHTGAPRASLCSAPAPASGRVAAPQQGGRPALHMRRAATRRACGEARGVCPILILVNRLPKEHPA